MKKKLTVIALSLALGLAVVQITNAGWGRGNGGNSGFGPGNGPGAGCAQNQNSAVDNETRQQFWEETQGLRQELFEKKSEYFQLMSQAEPDKDEARLLWSEVFDLQRQIQEKADSFGMTPGAGPGKGGGCGVAGAGAGAGAGCATGGGGGGGCGARGGNTPGTPAQ